VNDLGLGDELEESAAGEAWREGLQVLAVVVSAVLSLELAADGGLDRELLGLVSHWVGTPPQESLGGWVGSFLLAPSRSRPQDTSGVKRAVKPTR
jgi:hypothetical protein